METGNGDGLGQRQIVMGGGREGGGGLLLSLRTLRDKLNRRRENTDLGEWGIINTVREKEVAPRSRVEGMALARRKNTTFCITRGKGESLLSTTDIYHIHVYIRIYTYECSRYICVCIHVWYIWCICMILLSIWHCCCEILGNACRIYSLVPAVEQPSTVLAINNKEELATFIVFISITKLCCNANNTPISIHNTNKTFLTYANVQCGTARAQATDGGSAIL